MTDLSELYKIKDTLNNYKNLGIGSLAEDEYIFAQKTDEILHEIQEKLEVLEMIDKEIMELSREVSECGDENELVDIEVIRTKTLAKKTEKKLNKINPLNLSRVKVDLNERDTNRKCNKIAKTALRNRLLDITSYGGKVILTDAKGTFKTFQLNKKGSRQANVDCFCKKLKESSPFIQQWEELFKK